jgi:ribonucleotide monophosphatase NagD (HAD superfamily)
MGYDTELNYQKLWDVSYMLTTREIPYLATNPDYVCPTEWGSVPDCGSICDMIFNATGKRPQFIGKPEPLMPILTMEEVGVQREETAVIGDRIYTDIKSGVNAGAVSVLVMSGETTEEILNASDVKPDIVLKDAGEIMETV